MPLPFSTARFRNRSQRDPRESRSRKWQRHRKVSSGREFQPALLGDRIHGKAILPQRKLETNRLAGDGAERGKRNRGFKDVLERALRSRERLACYERAS